MAHEQLRIYLKGEDKRGLSVMTSSVGPHLFLEKDAPVQWTVTPGKDDYVKIRSHNLCLDLTNPEKNAHLDQELDVSGQYWQLHAVTGCTDLPGGGVARGVVGYHLRTMWGGSGEYLADHNGTAKMLAESVVHEGGHAHEWVIENSAGKLWTVADLYGTVELQHREPEIAVCDFGQPEPEIAVCDFGQPEITICLQPEPRQLCGGWGGAKPGGPDHLLASLRPLVLEEAKKNGFTGQDFDKFEFVQTKSQTVRGYNHTSKLRLGDDLFAHIRYFESIDDEPVELRSYAHGVGEHDTF